MAGRFGRQTGRLAPFMVRGRGVRILVMPGEMGNPAEKEERNQQMRDARVIGGASLGCGRQQACGSTTGCTIKPQPDAGAASVLMQAAETIVQESRRCGSASRNKKKRQCATIHCKPPLQYCCCSAAPRACRRHSCRWRIMDRRVWMQ